MAEVYSSWWRWITGAPVDWNQTFGSMKIIAQSRPGAWQKDQGRDQHGHHGAYCLVKVSEDFHHFMGFLYQTNIKLMKGSSLRWWIHIWSKPTKMFMFFTWLGSLLTWRGSGYKSRIGSGVTKLPYPCQFPLKNQVTLVQFFCSFLGSTNASKKGTNGQVLIL